MVTSLDSEPEYRQRVRKARIAVLTILGISLAVFIVIAALAVLNEGLARFTATLLSINPAYYTLALLCVFFSNLIGFPKWELFLNKLKISIESNKNLAIYLSMFSMDITPGRWGRAVVAYTLNRLTGKAFGKTFPAVVADILTDFLGFIVVALVASFLVQKYAPISVIISMLLLIPFFFIYFKPPFDYVKKRLWRFVWLRSIFKVAEMYFKSSRSLDLGTYIYAMIFTIPAVLLSGAALYFVILSFGIALPVSTLPTILFIYTSALLIGMVTGIPGTIGVTDAALLGYLVAFFPEFGVTFGVASAIVIFFRIASMWFMEGVSTAFLVYTMKYWRISA